MFDTYFEMLRHRRPSFSPKDKFVAEFLPELTPDGYGNWQYGSGDVIWACHLDTVHDMGGVQTLDHGDIWVRTTDSNCLGADCTSGIWLMREMIRANVPGLYVFHDNEEVGLIGARRRALNDPAQFHAVISLDRRGKNDVVTHQLSRRTCSDRFARGVSHLLSPDHKPTRGVFTDSAAYIRRSSNCTNISVGYFNEHTPEEHQDLPYLYFLRHRLIEVGHEIVHRLERSSRSPSTSRLSALS
jgi:hypothetical protein